MSYVLFASQILHTLRHVLVNFPGKFTRIVAISFAIVGRALTILHDSVPFSVKVIGGKLEDIILQ